MTIDYRQRITLRTLYYIFFENQSHFYDQSTNDHLNGSTRKYRIFITTKTTCFAGDFPLPESVSQSEGRDGCSIGHKKDELQPYWKMINTKCKEMIWLSGKITPKSWLLSYLGGRNACPSATVHAVLLTPEPPTSTALWVETRPQVSEINALSWS